MYIPETKLEKALDHTSYFIANNTKALIITGIALIALGSIAIAVMPLSALIGSALILAGAGILILTATRYKHVLAYLVVDPIFDALGIKINNDPKKHLIPERTLPYASIKYEGDQAVLELDEKIAGNPRFMGRYQGYLLGDTIEMLVLDVLKPMIFFSGLLKGDFSGKALEEGVKNVTIPEEFREEIQGIYEGYREYCKDRHHTPRLSLEDLYLAHKFADVYKSIGCQSILGVKMFSAVGCTTVVLKTEKGIEVSRNLDWPTFGKGGSHMILRRHKVNGKTIETHTLPGVVHALTARNDQGLQVIINELGTHAGKGMPYGLMARKVVESCQTVDEARERLRDITPASSCHLTVVDPKTASNFQFFVRDNEKFIERKLEKEGHLIVTNHAIDEEGRAVPGSEADYSSHKRYNKVVEILKDGTITNKAVSCSKASCVFDTVGTVIGVNGTWTQVSQSNYNSAMLLA